MRPFVWPKVKSSVGLVTMTKYWMPKGTRVYTSECNLAFRVLKNFAPWGNSHLLWTCLEITLSSLLFWNGFRELLCKSKPIESSPHIGCVYNYGSRKRVYAQWKVHWVVAPFSNSIYNVSVSAHNVVASMPFSPDPTALSAVAVRIATCYQEPTTKK